MNIEKGNNAEKYDLAPYVVTVIPDQEMLAAIHLEIEDRLKMIVSLKVEENKELDSTFNLDINSKAAQLESIYGVYTNQISRVIKETIFLNKYKKSKFLLTVNLIETAYKTDVLCHILNAIMLTLIIAKIEMKYLPVSSTCFVDGSENIYTEEEANASDKELTQIYLCKKLANDDDIVSFKISGGHLEDREVDKVFSHLCGSANIIGRKLLEYIHGLATN